MNKSFSVVDSIKNAARECNFIVRFNYQDNDFLVYSFKLDDNNYRILVSKIGLDVNNNYVINDISPDMKADLSNLVYNLVILLPSKEKEIEDCKLLINDFCSKYSLTVSNSCLVTGNQQYFSNCEIANTNVNTVESANRFYQKYISEDNNAMNLVNNGVWEVPNLGGDVNKLSDLNEHDSTIVNSESNSVAETIIPINDVNANDNQVPDLGNINAILPGHNISSGEDSNIGTFDSANQIEVSNVSGVNNIPNSDFNFNISSDTSINTNNFNENNDVQSNFMSDLTQDNMGNFPNPQEQILASLDTDVNKDVNVQPNVNKNAGFASSKYIIIGTICLVLAAVVVFLAIVLIKNR